jgi:hypothetical protein
MAITENEYTGNGSTVLYSFTFPYLEVADIKVSLDGTLTTAYTLANATTVQFNTAPANGVAIRLFRQTNDDALNAQFFPGSAIRSTDLNNNFTQNLYVTQESNRDATQGITTADAATATANTALSNSSAAVSTANTASSNASAAVSTANTASSNASAAVSTANTASSNATAAVNTANAATATANSAASDAATAISTANSAVSTANTASTTATNAVNTANSASSAASSAVSTANTASSNASAAVSTANTASSNATSAVNTANSALSTANAAASAVANAILYDIVANVAAIPASPANNDAVEVIDSTGIESFTPLTSIPGGFAGNSGLSVRIVYTTTGNTWTWIQYFPNDPETRYLKEAVTTSDTAPVSPSDGDLWYDSVGGRTYVYYDDGAGSQWVDTSPQGSGVSDAISEGDTSAEVIDTGSDGRFVVTTEGSERLRVDPSGRLLVGTSTSRDSNCSLQIVNDSTATFECFSGRNDNYGPGVIFAKSRGTTSSPTVVSSGDELGGLRFRGYDGTDYRNGAEIKAEVDGTPGAYDMPSRIVLSTTADGTSSPTERLRIDSSGRVGIGATTVNATRKVEIVQPSGYVAGLRVLTDGSGAYNQFFSGTSNFRIGSPHNTSALVFDDGASERVRIDSSGRLGIGTSSPAHYLHVSASVNDAVTNIVNTDTTNGYGLSVVAGGSASNRYIARFADAGNNAKAIILANGNVGIGTASPESALNISNNTPTNAGGIRLQNVTAGNIGCFFTDLYNLNYAVQGAHVFTNFDGTTERARIDSSGRLLVGTSTYSFSSGGVALLPSGQVQATKNADFVIEINRTGNDGGLVRFYQDTVQEGTISVSGTTVSYNGAHLSRWSQLPTGAEREEILRGTLLSNLDEMCEWGEEDNEQLNRMKVSEVEGDKNVSGVFQAWDDDDDTYTNDFYCAMTGDFIVRIGAGTTVERGDLLMSAGDGTAKPQADDLVRSCTVAKVTSTTVSCTHPDGSYCVPCVLMAC